MDYFCYISRTKVDRLLEGLNPEKLEEYTEKDTAESELKGNAQVGLNVATVLNLFKGEASYGRKAVVQRERKVKAQYVEKLRTVLTGIVTTSGITPVRAHPTPKTSPESIYYYYNGNFKVIQPVRKAEVGDIITLVSEVDASRLLLDCSLRFFSEGIGADGKLMIHSGNVRFFSGEIAMRLETVFILLATRPREMVGSPLFLKVSGATSDHYVRL